MKAQSVIEAAAEIAPKSDLPETLVGALEHRSAKEEPARETAIPRIGIRAREWCRTGSW